MKTSSIAVETLRSTTQSDSIVRQTNKRSSYLSYTTMNNKHIFNTGEVTKWHVQLCNKVDEIAAYHDICYDMGKNKGESDKQMVKSLDEIPYGQMPKWGQTARFLINTKQKLGLGVKQRKTKNGKSRPVKQIGKKN